MWSFWFPEATGRSRLPRPEKKAQANCRVAGQEPPQALRHCEFPRGDPGKTEAEPGTTANPGKVSVFQSPSAARGGRPEAFGRSMRFLLLSFLVFLSGCISRPSLENSPFISSAEFAKRLEERWPLQAIQSLCTPENREDHGIQGPVVFVYCNRKGSIYSGSATGFDEIAWGALVVKGRVRGYYLMAVRGKDSWGIDGYHDKDLPFRSSELHEILDK